MTRRMFSDDITTSDAFLDMPKGSQLLYFHLGISADDDGFIGNPKMTMRILGSSEDEMKVLFGKKFLIPFPSGVCVIKHWRINNYLRKDIYRETKYTDEKSQLYIRENGAYTLRPDGALPLPKGHFPLINQGEKDVHVTSTQRARHVHLGKDRIGKVSIDKKQHTRTQKTKKIYLTFGEFGKVLLTKEEHEKLIDRIGEKNTNILIVELDNYIESKPTKYLSHYAVILNWARRRALEIIKNKSNTIG